MSHLLPSFFNPTDGGNPPPPPSSPAPSQMDSTTPPSTSPVTSDKSSSVQHPSSVDTSKSSSSGTGNGGINVSGGTGTTGGTGTGTGTGAGSAGGDANSGSTGSAAGTGENGGLVNEPTTTTSPVPAPAPPETVPTSTASMTTSVVSPTTTSALPTSTTSAAHSSSTTSAAQPTTTSSAAPVPTTVVVTTMPEPTATALPPPPSPPSGSGSGSNIGVIIGTIAGGICGVIVLIWFILIPIRKAQRKKKEVEWLTFGTENDHVNGSESTADVVRGGRPAADMDNSTAFAKDISSTTPDMYQMNSITNTGGASTTLYSHLDGNGSSPWVGPPPVPHPPSVGPDGSVLSGHDTTGYPYYEYDAQGYPPYYSASATGAQAGMQVGGIVGGAAVTGYVSPNASSPEQHPQRIRGFGTGPPASIRTSPVVQPTRYQGSMHPSNSMGSMSYSQLSHGNNAYSNASQMSMGQGGGGGALQQPMPTASTGLPQSDTAAVSRNASSSATSTAVAVPAYSAQGLRRTASGSSIHRLDDDKSCGEDHEVMQREQIQAAVHQGSSSGEAGDNSAYDGLAVTYDQHGEPSHGDTRIDPPRQPHGEAPGQTISYRRGQGQIRQRHAQGQDQSQGQEQGQQVARDRESLHEGTIDVSMTDQKHDFRITNDS